MAPSDILYICACGRRTTLGMKCVWCSTSIDNDDPTIEWSELEKFIDCDEFIEEEEDEDVS